MQLSMRARVYLCQSYCDTIVYLAKGSDTRGTRYDRLGKRHRMLCIPAKTREGRGHSDALESVQSYQMVNNPGDSNLLLLRCAVHHFQNVCASFFFYVERNNKGMIILLFLCVCVCEKWPTNERLNLFLLLCMTMNVSRIGTTTIALMILPFARIASRFAMDMLPVTRSVASGCIVHVL
jgi:hypothetical protein